MLKLNYNKKYKSGDFLQEEESLHEIAVIGVSAKLPQADSPDSFWDLLCSGTDAISTFPKSRIPDVSAYMKYKNNYPHNSYCDGSYLPHIDYFDHEFFNITAKEASLMDPNQRIFLEVACKAIEDAGYGGGKLSGSLTGVYVGYSGNGEYQTFISDVQPESVILSEAGNIQSIIASRLAYTLDLKGPSLLVDTACSSSLVAVHMACQAIRSNECDMAIAGGIKISFLPFESDDKLGIESSSGKTRTFDDNSDGTVFGEGTVALLLKPLQRALNDHDHIYAVIKGSAVNQDGRSIGITAPNVLAQENCITQAWDNAGIEPETVSYMEAHGTGTKLGDPVEVDAISRAFRKYTNKQQFCGLGSIKSVYGHLDHAAGILGLLKVILMLKNRKIPPTLNFSYPNRNIDFISSPVYVSDKVQEWETVNNHPRRCGVSSFGLSGTNCHVVLEEAPAYKVNEHSKTVKEEKIHLFSLSAKKKHVLEKMVTIQRKFIENNIQEDIKNVCYTVNTGRTHSIYRLVILVRNMDELLIKLKHLEYHGLNTFEDQDIFYGFHFVVPNIKNQLENGEMYGSDKVYLTSALNNFIKGLSNNLTPIDFRKICNQYIQGADISWHSFYSLFSDTYYKLSMPGYIFDNIRCWPNIPSTKSAISIKKEKSAKDFGHPFIDECAIVSLEQDIYVSKFSMNEHWVLREHKILGKSLLPGTAYLEMIETICSRYYPTEYSYEIRDVFFLNPLIVEPNTEIEVQMIVKERKDKLDIIIASKQSESHQWVKYCEANVYSIQLPLVKSMTLDDLYTQMQPINENNNNSEESFFDFGPRWTTLLDRLYVGKEEVLAEFSLPDCFSSDLENFRLHPSLLDVAVNVASQVSGNGLYLPLSYNSIRVQSALPGKIISHVRRKKVSHSDAETMSFDVTIYDSEGNILFVAQDFTVKRVNSIDFHQSSDEISSTKFYQINWVQLPDLPNNKLSERNGKMLCIRFENSCNDLLNHFSVSSNIIDVIIGSEFKRISPNQYICSGTKEDYDKLFSMLGDVDIYKILHMTTLLHKEQIKERRDIENIIQNSVYNLKNMLRSMIDSQKNRGIEIILLSKNGFQVTGNEALIHPLNAAYLTWGQSIPDEYPNLSCRSIDIDDNTFLEIIEKEIYFESQQYITAIRNQVRYQKEISVLSQINSTIKKNLPLRQEGVYLISGGTGALGNEVAKFLARKEKIHLVLVGRTTEKEGNISYTQRIQDTKKHINALGSTVEYLPADISNEEQVKRVVQHIKGKYKKINGIIHASGIASKGFIINRTDEETDQVLSSKIYGAWLLDKYTVNEEMDFFISFSSISSLYGSAGQSDYAAANAYLDVFSDYRNSHGRKTLTINWAPWKDIGMAAENNVQDNGVFKMLDVSEGIEAFENIFGHEAGSVVVGRLNEKLLATKLKEVDILFDNEIISRIQKSVSTVKTINPKEENGSTSFKKKNSSRNEDVMNTVSNIWRDILGIEEVSIYDSFGSLGGDSITATRIYKEIDKEYPGKIDIGSIFAFPSILEISKHIENQIQQDLAEKTVSNKDRVSHGSDELIDDVLKQLRDQSLSVSEAMELI